MFTENHREARIFFEGELELVYYLLLTYRHNPANVQKLSSESRKMEYYLFVQFIVLLSGFGCTYFKINKNYLIQIKNCANCLCDI